jgi:hypothetical protein
MIYVTKTDHSVSCDLNSYLNKEDRRARAVGNQTTSGVTAHMEGRQKMTTGAGNERKTFERHTGNQREGTHGDRKNREANGSDIQPLGKSGCRRKC